MMLTTAMKITVRKVCTNLGFYSTSHRMKLTPKPLDYWAMNKFTRATNAASSAAGQMLCLFLALLLGSAAIAEIRIQETPDGGVQPRLTVDDSGNIHLLYFKKRLSAPSARYSCRWRSAAGGAAGAARRRAGGVRLSEYF